jgi:hypothetical protein
VEACRCSGGIQARTVKGSRVHPAWLPPPSQRWPQHRDAMPPHLFLASRSPKHHAVPVPASGATPPKAHVVSHWPTAKDGSDVMLTLKVRGVLVEGDGDGGSGDLATLTLVVWSSARPLPELSIMMRAAAGCTASTEARTSTRSLRAHNFARPAVGCAIERATCRAARWGGRGVLPGPKLHGPVTFQFQSSNVGQFECRAAPECQAAPEPAWAARRPQVGPYEGRRGMPGGWGSPRPDPPALRPPSRRGQLAGRKAGSRRVRPGRVGRPLAARRGLGAAPSSP